MRGILGSENSGNSILVAVSILMDIEKRARVKKSCQWRMVSVILLTTCNNGKHLDSPYLSSLTTQTLHFRLQSTNVSPFRLWFRACIRSRLDQDATGFVWRVQPRNVSCNAAWKHRWFITSTILGKRVFFRYNLDVGVRVESYLYLDMLKDFVFTVTWFRFPRSQRSAIRLP